MGRDRSHPIFDETAASAAAIVVGSTSMTGSAAPDAAVGRIYSQAPGVGSRARQLEPPARPIHGEGGGRSGEVEMNRYPTKLFLAGVAALALLALGTTSILAPAWAVKPMTSDKSLPIGCTDGEIAKRVGAPDGTLEWACASDTDTNTNAATDCASGEYLDGDGTCNAMPADFDTLGDLDCTTDQIAKWDGLDWVCADGTGDIGLHR